MKKKSIYNNLMRILTIFGGATGFLYSFNMLFRSGDWIFPLFLDSMILLTYNILGMLSTSFTLLIAIKPNNPIPWHFIVVGILGVSVIFSCHFWPGLVILFGAFIGMIGNIGGENKDEENSES